MRRTRAWLIAPLMFFVLAAIACPLGLSFTGFTFSEIDHRAPWIIVALVFAYPAAMIVVGIVKVINRFRGW